MPKTVILGAARTPFGKMGGGLAVARRHRPRRHGDRRRARARRGGAGAGPARGLRPGAAGRPGPDPEPPGADQGRASPRRSPSETVNKVCASGLRSAGIVDQAVRAGDLEVAVAGGMESMSQAPYLLKQARFGFRMGDAKALDAHGATTGSPTPSPASTWARRPTRSATSSRSPAPTWTSSRCARTSWRSQATDEGRLPEEIVAVTIKSQEGRHHRRGRRGAAARLARSRRCRSCAARSTRTARTPPATRRASTTAPARSCCRATSGRRPTASTALATIVAQAAVADDFPYLARTPGERHEGGAREGRPVGRRHRPVRDQRGLRLGGAQLDAHARRRRVEGQRERRRDRPRPPDRRQRRPHPDDARRTSCAAAAAASAWRRSAPAAARATP